MKKSLLILAFISSLAFSSCGVYSFTGGSTGDAETFSVAYFDNKATIVNTTLSQYLTEQIKDKFLRSTQLSMVNSEGDLTFEGSIIEYSVTNAAIQGTNQASQNRLTITVRVVYKNKLVPEQNFETNFSQFADFPITQSLSQVENQLVEEITANIVQQIFNASVANW